MAEYARENITSLSREIAPLILSARAERYVASKSRRQPNLEVYCEAEDKNLLRCFSARVDHCLVGFAVFFLAPRPHTDDLLAALDVLYVLPEHRSNGVATGLLRFGEAELRADRVNVIAVGTHDVRIVRWFRMIFGYSYAETLLEKVL